MRPARRCTACPSRCPVPRRPAPRERGRQGYRDRWSVVKPASTRRRTGGSVPQSDAPPTAAGSRPRPSPRARSTVPSLPAHRTRDLHSDLEDHCLVLRRNDRRHSRRPPRRSHSRPSGPSAFPPRSTAGTAPCPMRLSASSALPAAPQQRLGERAPGPRPSRAPAAHEGRSHRPAEGEVRAQYVRADDDRHRPSPRRPCHHADGGCADTDSPHHDGSMADQGPHIQLYSVVNQSSCDQRPVRRRPLRGAAFSQPPLRPRPVPPLSVPLSVSSVSVVSHPRSPLSSPTSSESPGSTVLLDAFTAGDRRATAWPTGRAPRAAPRATARWFAAHGGHRCWCAGRERLRGGGHCT